MKFRLDFTPEDIYSGAVALMAVHIAAIPKLSYIYYEKIWEGNRFSFNDHKGCDGTFIFNSDELKIIGAIRDNRSDRIYDYPNMNAELYFESAGEKIRKTAHDQLMQYLLAEYQISGGLFKKASIIDVPTVTAGFWSEGSDIFACEDPEEFILNGGRVLTDLCENEPQRFRSFAESYELNEKEINFARILIQAKLNPSDHSISRDFITQTFGTEYNNQSVLQEQLDGFGITLI